MIESEYVDSTNLAKVRIAMHVVGQLTFTNAHLDEFRMNASRALRQLEHELEERVERHMSKGRRG